MALVQRGSANRHTAATRMNERSSRSHRWAGALLCCGPCCAVLTGGCLLLVTSMLLTASKPAGLQVVGALQGVSFPSPLLPSPPSNLPTPPLPSPACSLLWWRRPRRSRTRASPKCGSPSSTSSTWRVSAQVSFGVRVRVASRTAERPRVCLGHVEVWSNRCPAGPCRQRARGQERRHRRAAHRGEALHGAAAVLPCPPPVLLGCGV